MFVPELKMPVAKARSRFGNHSATVLIAAGKLPASPSPSRNRISMKPATLVEYPRPNQLSTPAANGPTTGASAWPAAARLQTTIAMREPGPRAKPIDQPARNRQANRIRELEGEDDVRVVDFRPAELLLKGAFSSPRTWRSM